MRSAVIAVCLCATLSLGCFGVTMRTDGTQNVGRAPDWKVRQGFYLWGLVGEHHVDVTEICKDGKAVQMQTIRTFGNMFLTFITFGLYVPGEARVWCE